MGLYLLRIQPLACLGRGDTSARPLIMAGVLGGGGGPGGGVASVKVTWEGGVIWANHGYLLPYILLAT